MSLPLLSARITAGYPGRPPALDDVAFDVHEGEISGLAGESGAGKSTLALAVLRLLDSRGGYVRGSMYFDGQDLLGLTERDLRRIRGRAISLVMQSPASALNPVLRLETHLKEAWRVHGQERWTQARPAVKELLHRMGLPAGRDFLRRFPGQVSVGQAQRLVIAMAVLHKPRLVIADEPTSALDPASRSGILELFRGLRREHGTAILYISHDVASMRELCDSTHVLRAGKLIPCSLESAGGAEAAFAPSEPVAISG